MASPKTQYHPLQWRKSPHGTWEREIDECEEFYNSSIRDGEGCYPVTSCASFIIRTSDTVTTEEDEDRRIENAFRKAWTILHHDHPTLRSRVERSEDGIRWKRVYSTFEDEEEEKRWLDSTFKAIDAEGAPLQWFNNTSAPFKISTLFLVKPKEKNNYHRHLFLRSPHDITDGVGVLQLLNNLFKHAALAYEEGARYTLPAWGNEHERLSPCLRLVTETPRSFTESQIKRFEEIQTQNGIIYTHPGLLSLPLSSNPTTSQHGKRQRVALSVSKATTENILRSCKTIAPGVSVTHVFTSALALALSELQPRKEQSYAVRYANQSMVNLRPHCRHPYNTPEHAAAAYHTVSAQALGVDLVVPASTDTGSERNVDQLSTIAIKVRDYFNTVRPVSPSDENIIFAPMVFKSLTAPPGLDPHAVSETPFCPVPLSSIGNIASIVSPKHGPFELSSVWAASEPIGAGVAVFLATWDGNIELSGVFDTRYHNADYVEKFLGYILNCALEGLGINWNL
ncbi:hypothetical protein F5Y00DRAFT_242419 [Daldinia vernicosa]|uniref:uncharacterized protein n=1 Tax=Daldinia vernicosa TaxID=114800 RepID=UPI0020077A9F|nr:uncharacterized protein F5Y00DRAFT_242419 [Daldinia vernicosa]KAI0847147.1 hypothetical protein F5Y00DRAFT_242419 [Daldinia vernicosa]